MSTLIPSFIIYRDQKNILRSQVGRGRLPAGAEVMYTEDVRGGRTFLNDYTRASGKGRLGYTIDSVRRDICESDNRWYETEAENRMDAGEEAIYYRDYDNAEYEFEQAAHAAQRCGAHRLYIEAMQAIGDMYTATQDFASAVEYLQQALDAADEFLPNDVQLCSQLRDSLHQNEGRAVAPEVFILLEELLELNMSDSAEDWCLAEEKAVEALDLARLRFGGQHWLVAACLRELAYFKDGSEAREMLLHAAVIASEWGPPNDVLRRSIAYELQHPYDDC